MKKRAYNITEDSGWESLPGGVVCRDFTVHDREDGIYWIRLCICHDEEAGGYNLWLDERRNGTVQSSETVYYPRPWNTVDEVMKFIDDHIIFGGERV